MDKPERSLAPSFSDMELNLIEHAQRQLERRDETAASDTVTEASVCGSEASDRPTSRDEARGGTPGTREPSRLATWKRALNPFRRKVSPIVLEDLDRDRVTRDECDGEAEQARFLRSPASNDMLLSPSPSRSPPNPSFESLPLRTRAWLRIVAAARAVAASWYKILIAAAIVTLIVLTAVKGVTVFSDILAWFQARNNWGGWGMFLGLYTAVVALFLPGVVLIVGAGFVFGFWKALLATWVGGAIGQAFAFLLARYLLADWVDSFVRVKWRKWEVIDRAIAHDGWKLVLIMRLSPVIPYNLLNIAMGTTSMPFWQFAVVSALGIVFECSIFCYLGSMATSITSIVSGRSTGAATVHWLLLGLSGVMCVCGAVFVSYSIKNAIRRAEAAELLSIRAGRAGRGAYAQAPSSERGLEDAEEDAGGEEEGEAPEVVQALVAAPPLAFKPLDGGAFAPGVAGRTLNGSLGSAFIRTPSFELRTADLDAARLRAGEASMSLRLSGDSRTSDVEMGESRRPLSL